MLIKLVLNSCSNMSRQDIDVDQIKCFKVTIHAMTEQLSHHLEHASSREGKYKNIFVVFIKEGVLFNVECVCDKLVIEYCVSLLHRRCDKH